MCFVGFVSSKASPVYGVFARAKRFEILDHWLHDFLFQSSAACLVPSIAQTQRLSPSMQHPKPIQEHLTAIPDRVELIILKIDVSELFIYICRQENVFLEMMVMIITCRLNLELIPDILCVLIIFIRYITVIQSFGGSSVSSNLVIRVHTLSWDQLDFVLEYLLSALQFIKTQITNQFIDRRSHELEAVDKAKLVLEVNFFWKEPTTTSLPKLMYFSSLLGLHLMFTSVLPRFLTNRLVITSQIVKDDRVKFDFFNCRLHL